MIICIDYDDTYTRDPSLWDSFISNVKHRNHTVICVTMRSESEGKAVSFTLSKSRNSKNKRERYIFT